MCQQTKVDDFTKKGAYSKIGFIEFIEFLCRLLYARFSINLDANLLGQNYTQLAGIGNNASSVPDSVLGPTSTETSIMPS